MSPAFYLVFEVLLISLSAFFQFRRLVSNVCRKLRNYDTGSAPQTPGYTILRRNAVGSRVRCGKGLYAFLNAFVMEWEVSGLFETPEGAQYAPPWLYLLNNNASLFSRPYLSVIYTLPPE